MGSVQILRHSHQAMANINKIAFAFAWYEQAVNMGKYLTVQTCTGQKNEKTQGKDLIEEILVICQIYLECC